ncbi:MAG: hypothetical protein AVDCRST_MAG67-569, partial [uncultured Solirubrobacteraceae bacterium]
GADEEEAAQQAPRQRRRDGRGARAHRASAECRRAQAVRQGACRPAPPRTDDARAVLELRRQARGARGDRVRRPARVRLSDRDRAGDLADGLRLSLLHPARLLHRHVDLSPARQAGGDEGVQGEV